MWHFAPNLQRYTEEVLLGEVWQRPQLSLRDRSIATLSVLIARNNSGYLFNYLNIALENGVKPSEISGIVTHLAFYSGWSNALAALQVVQNVFTERGISIEHLPSKIPSVPSFAHMEELRHTAVKRKFGDVAPGLVQLTKDVIFDDLWLQSDLSIQDRCIVTICSVIATAQSAQLAFYLNRAMDNGITQAALSELMLHVAFYSGWSSVYTALAVVKDVFESRPE